MQPASSADTGQLVAGVLDRWQRALVERVTHEQRQRFEDELFRRDNLIGDLRAQIESLSNEHEAALHALRSEHTAEIAARERVLSEKERALADRQRELTLLRTATASPRRRPWFAKR